MKKPHLTLYGQILCWFFLNLALVAGVLFLVLHVQFKMGLWSLFSGRVNDRIEALCGAMAVKLRDVSRTEWDSILEDYSGSYGVTFSLLGPDGTQLLGGPAPGIPAELKELIQTEFPVDEGQPGRFREEDHPRRDPFRGPGGPGGPGPPPGPDGPGWRPDGPPPGPGNPGPQEHPRRPNPPRVIYYERDAASGRQWVAVVVSLHNREFRHPPDGVLVASADGLGGNALFFDWRPWAWTLLGILIVSALIWFPFVHRVSRRLRKLTAAAESISEGNFDVEVASGRTDELGRLSRAVQQMAARLDDYVCGQKRFLGDIAHELCSPLVRARMALGILEEGLAQGESAKLAPVNEEMEELSQLVNELLDFSQASLKPANLPRTRVDVSALVEEVVRREGGGAAFAMQVEAGLALESNAELLKRALGNLVRNAVRYSGESGGLEVRAARGGGELWIEVLDRGPGVPDGWLTRVFEPFSRPESARTREGGGVGLGLAIARTCAEALGGTIAGRNRKEGGFAVELRFPANG